MDLGVPGLGPAVEIGRGGFAVVYRAEQLALGRPVAVKVITAGGADPMAAVRFARERAALAQLSWQPNIVTVFDSGDTADGRPYLVMEYLPDGSLADRLRRSGPLPAAEVVRYGLLLAGALAQAHHRGILHRDVKPENVLIGPMGEPQLSDFGIATLANATETVDGALVATLAHVAPELLAGAAPTPASDVYSLGSTLFTLLAGHPPFAADEGQPVVRLLARLATEPVPDLRPRGVPDGLCRVLEHALAKDPADRPSSVPALRDRLAGLGRGLPPGPGPSGAGARTVVGRPRPVILAAVSVLSVGLGSLAGIAALTPQSPEPATAVPAAGRPEPAPAAPPPTRAPAGPADTSRRPAPTTAPLTGVDWGNATYLSRCFPAGGTAVPTPVSGWQAARAATRLDVAQPVYGDRTGDGRPEAALRLSCTVRYGSQADVVDEVAVYTASPAGPTLLGTLLRDPLDGQVVAHLDIGGGALTLAATARSQDAPLCCPDRLVQTTWRVSDGRLMRLGRVEGANEGPEVEEEAPGPAGELVAPPAGGGPGAAAIAARMTDFFLGVNTGDYATSFAVYTRRLRGGRSLDEFAAERATSVITEASIRRLTPSGGGSYVAFLAVTTTQSPEHGPQGETCTRWTLDYHLLRLSGSWYIDAVRPHGGTASRPC
jgi:hypothetical protein